MRKVCIYGLGAIGSLMAARLARSGCEVSAIARGSNLQAVAAQGLHLLDSDGQTALARIHVTDDPRTLGVQDLVVISVKSNALLSIAPEIAPLIGPDTVIFSAMNGVPWWFMHGMAQQHKLPALSTVDPQGAISAALNSAQVLGCVTHLSAMVPEPGVVRAVAGNTLIIGDPATAAQPSPRLEWVAQCFEQAGFQVQRTDCIQKDIWFKLWGNMTMNPVSFLCEATGDRILQDAHVRDFLSACMCEAQEIGQCLGLSIDSTPEERHAVTSKLGAFKTSMLQDLERAKPIELDALLGVVVEMADRLQIASPYLRALLGLSRLKAQQLHLY